MPTITHTPRQQPVATTLDQLLADAEASTRTEALLSEGNEVCILPLVVKP